LYFIHKFWTNSQHNHTAMSTLSIIGVPFNGGQPRGGVEKGPGELQKAGLVSVVEKAGWKVVHNENIPIPAPPADDDFTGAKRPRFVGAVCADLCAAASARARAGDFVLTVGGDHSIAAGSIAGILAAQPDTFVVWVDAHADINTPATSDSGNIHGMPVALLARLCGKVPGFEYLDDKPALKLENIVYIGLRDVDAGEKKLLAEHKVRAFFMSDVTPVGIKGVMEKVLEYAGSRPIHLSFDVDGLDPEYMPSTGTPVKEGLSLQDGQYICKSLASTQRVRSFDLVEVNPDLGDEQGRQNTCKNSLLLVESLLTRAQA